MTTSVEDKDMTAADNMAVVVRPNKSTSKQHIVDMILNAAAKQVAPKVSRKEMAEIPDLSIPVLVANLKSVLHRAKGISSVQAFMGRYFAWESPSLTISGLLVYTYFCFHPNFLAAVPLLLVLGEVFVPNYIKKYPTEEMFMALATSPPAEFQDPTDEELIVEQAAEPAKRDILLSLRQAQASLGRLSKSLDKLEAFKAGPGNFKDPGQSCAIVVIMLLLMPLSVYLVSLSNPRHTFILVGWVSTLTANPSIKAFTQKLKHIEIPESTLLRRLVAHLKPQFEVKDDPYSREVEIFEVQRQGITPRFHDKSIFSPYIYSDQSAFRLSQQLPPGTSEIDDVIPPAGWCFDADHGWEVDDDSKRWLSAHDSLEAGEHGWVYDKSGEWRRRRWLRTCFFESSM